MIELAEQLEQVPGQEVVPGLRDEAGGLAAALPPIREAAEREELMRMAEDGEEEVVLLLQPVRGELGGDGGEAPGAAVALWGGAWQLATVAARRTSVRFRDGVSGAGTAR